MISLAPKAAWRPDLTLPAAEAAAVRAAYGRAGAILEYGSGGSTLIAAEVAGARVLSVESDADWLAQMAGWLVAHPPKAEVVLHHADIGPTRDWGYPVARAPQASWPGYAASVWDIPEFAAPDVVLIDGRFRLACFLTVLARTTRPVTVLWDDYAARPHYHQAEALAPVAERIGRMARFTLSPAPLPPGFGALLDEANRDPR